MSKKRKGNGEGSFTTLPSGKVRGRFVDEINGVVVRKSFTASSATACRTAHKEWLKSEEKVPIEKVKTVQEWAAHWLEIYCKPNVSYSTYKDYKMYVNRHIIPAIGKIKLPDIKPAHIAKLFAEAKNRKGKELSRSAKGNLKICLNGIFETAMENNLCRKNPASSYKLPKLPPRTIKAFGRTQIVKVIDYIKEHEHGLLIAFLLYTGLRIGEFLALMWVDVDTEARTFYVHRTLSKGEKGLFVKDTTKTEKERTIPYDDNIASFVESLPRTSMFVISRKDGRHHTHKTYGKLYKKFFEDLNKQLEKEKIDQIPYMSPHKCRHTFATYMLRSGADIRAIQTLLGHSSVKTTEIYTEVDVNDLKNNVKKLTFK